MHVVRPASYITETFTSPVIVRNDDTGEVTVINGDSVRVWVSAKGKVTVSGYSKATGRNTQKVVRQNLTFLGLVEEGRLSPVPGV